MTSSGRAVGAVDLVDRDDGLQPDLQRLADDELGLRHRPLGGVDQQHRAIDHRQDALDLAAEIGVAGRVDDVDARAFPFHRGRLGQNGDATFLFDVAGIHRAFLHALVFPVDAGLFQKFVDQRCLAMIDMRDDRDIAECHV